MRERTRFAMGSDSIPRRGDRVACSAVLVVHLVQEALERHGVLRGPGQQEARQDEDALARPVLVAGLALGERSALLVCHPLVLDLAYRELDPAKLGDLGGALGDRRGKHDRRVLPLPAGALALDVALSRRRPARAG